jgi:lysophospholipase L1-like esterase
MTKRPTILLLGDSLTQTAFEGWGAILADVYQRRADVLNRGFSGYNTRFFLRLGEDALSAHDIENASLVLIFFGANDAAILEHNDHHHVPLQEFSENLKTLVKRVRVQGKHILLITAPPVHHQQRFDYQIKRYGDKATGVLERTNEVTGQYAAACKQVATDLDLPCLDLHHCMQQDKDYGRFFQDGLHFSSQGHERVGQEILNAIALHFPDFSVTPDPITGQFANSGSSCPGLSSRGPYHDEIDSKDLVKSFK